MMNSDIVITRQRKKTELIALGVCFILANLLNLYSIVVYNTSFVELFTSLGYVAVTTVALYVIWGGVRIVWYFVKKLIRKK